MVHSDNEKMCLQVTGCYTDILFFLFKFVN
jgi:hypothetical protein